MKKKVAIFGGSFNPPHIGHKKIIEIVRDSFECDEIWLMPSGHRADKKMHTENHHRLNLARLLAENLKKATSAMQGNAKKSMEGDDKKSIPKTKAPEIIVSTIEIDRAIPTATIDTLRELEQNNPDSDFYFIISSELVPDIRKFWDEGHELFKKAKFIILERAGSHAINTLDLPPCSTIIPPSAGIVPEISSTILRGLNTPDQLSQWTDKELADYIIKNQIYGFKKEN